MYAFLFYGFGLSQKIQIDRRLSVAPMMDWTDRHCRYFHRLVAPNALLYTEMVTTAALIHGDRARHLRFDPTEHPVALQLGGSDPKDLGICALWGLEAGYDEINLNCGCPSPRVQKGAFGACLMAEPQLVAAGVVAMREAVQDRIPVTVKTRIGIDYSDSYQFLCDFIGTIHDKGGCRIFIIHARKAWLSGLSPKENREVPPLDYQRVYDLKRDFPDCQIVLNGGLTMTAAVAAAMPFVDGVMIGREAYHNTWFLRELHELLWPKDEAQTPCPLLDRTAIVAVMQDYARRQADLYGTPAHSVMRHMHGLYKGLPLARVWRRTLGERQWPQIDPAMTA